MHRSTRALLLIVCAAAGCGAAPAKSTTAATPAAAPGGPPQPGALKPWKEAIKDTEVVAGFVNARRVKDGTLLFELTPAELDRDFAMALHLGTGLGNYEIYAGLIISEARLVQWHRVGGRVLLVHRNTRYAAAPGSAVALAAARNAGDSVIAALPIVSDDGPDGRVLVDATRLFASDYADLAPALKRAYGGAPDLQVGFDESRSYVKAVRGYPRNVEIDAMLTYQASGGLPPVVQGPADRRSLAVVVRTSLFALPELPMARRAADDRVGFFTDASIDPSAAPGRDDMVEHIVRWRLEPGDVPGRRPRQPIVYYIDRSVPVEYRGYVKEGIEAWNRAFAAAGFEQAIVARDAPDDPSWNPEDIRYSTVSWSVGMPFAIGPQQHDPRTGEILDADILIGDQIWRRVTDDFFRLTDGNGPGTSCRAGAGLRGQVALGGLLSPLAAGPRGLTPEFAGNAMRWLVMHEVGHTLGLRHNFGSSATTPYDKLHDSAFTGEHGLSSSVMDYPAANLAVDPSKQGDFFNRVPGDYDVWAIRYGYTIFPSPDERSGLEAIADVSTDPRNTLASDEDLYLDAADPRVSTWDVGDDPIRFARDRAALATAALPHLEERLIAAGESYAALRGGLAVLLYDRVQSSRPVVRTIGGVHVTRDHRGQPGQRAPLTPVPAAEQRAALRTIAELVFGERAFDLPPALLARLAPDRTARLDLVGPGSPAGYTMLPVHALVLDFQSVVLDELLAPARLSRVQGNELLVAAGDRYTLVEHMTGLTDAVFAELIGRPRAVSAFRRNLQRAYVDRLAAMAVPAGAPSGPADAAPHPLPADARALARAELVRIRAAARRGSSDPTTRAHLGELDARIGRALTAQTVLPAR